MSGGARILDGKATAQAVRAEVAARVAALEARGRKPGLAVVLVGDDPASQVYVRNKDRAASEAGIAVRTLKLPAETRQEELLEGAATVVAPGGLLIYSTCSLEPEENSRQVERFLGRHPEFRREASRTVPPQVLTAEGDLMVLPQRDGMDGAYGARLRRVS